MAGPRALIIAGPNGAGKTTFATEFLTVEGQCHNFINADLIAAGLSPFRPELMALEALRLMLEHMRRSVARRQDFAIETTLAGRAYINYIKEWQAVGHRVKIIFLRLDSPELAVARVKHRVAQGGHSIPENDVRRRFQRSCENFHHVYRMSANSWQVFDASQWPPVLVDQGVNP